MLHAPGKGVAARRDKIHGMSARYTDLRDFLKLLESRGELKRITEPVSPHLEMTEIADRVLHAAGEVDLVFNTPRGAPGNSGPRVDGYEIRTAAVATSIPCVTTVQAAAACVQGIEELVRGDIGVRSLQDLHAHLAAWRGRR